MPGDSIEPCGPYVTLRFEAGMSDAEVRENMDRLLALGDRYNLLVDELERTAAADDTPVSKQARIFELFVDFATENPRLRTPSFINLALPLVDRLFDEAVRKTQPPRSDGAGRKRAREYTLSVSIQRAYLALAGDILRRSGRTHPETEIWLCSKLAKYGIKNVTAAAIMEWRDEIIARMGKRQAGELEAEGEFLDLMAQTFKDHRPAQDPDWNQAEELAADLLKMAKLEQERSLFTLA